MAVVNQGGLSTQSDRSNPKPSVTDGCIKHIAETGYTPMTGAGNIKNLEVDDISRLLIVGLFLLIEYLQLYLNHFSISTI